MMIIVYDQVHSKYEWFNEENANSFIFRWKGGFETLYYTAKKQKFILVHENIEEDEHLNLIKVQKAEKMYQKSAMVWLVNHGFDLPDFLKTKHIREDNEI